MMLIWHHRLIRASNTTLKYFDHTLLNLKAFLPIEYYDSCSFSKQIHFSFSISSSKSIASFDIIHLDLWSPYKHSTF